VRPRIIERRGCAGNPLVIQLSRIASQSITGRRDRGSEARAAGASVIGNRLRQVPS
jgi:hypothetical protein